ncbi:carbohydrate kinase family protein [Agromyces sp. CFH 90414]|uniref:Carbohydrate kinase family protein n=1 Tax=Agromyces agglutinans TaxID=2662258 RepID=A0A6I2F814_9MICO|nr:PfkB family carbohydrate kinase [Agromyces agglutinans]MRG59917.1 carbohydrate kinase family protein [Agromyces agglutinans]
MPASVYIIGPAAWNRLVVLDRLPEPVPHMQFALDEWETLGGTSAGKALGLAGLGREIALEALIGDDADGRRVRGALEAAGIALTGPVADRTERHLNLMTRAGERVSLYLSTPTDDPAAEPAGETGTDEAGTDEATLAAMSAAEAIVLDLSPRAARRIPLARAANRPIWTDVHDYDGESAFHRPFLDAADVVFMNADRIGDPWPFLERCIRGGASLAVCTLGADGAIAVDGGMTRHTVAAEPVEVLDTNGAGDAFMSGVLDAVLSGAGLTGSGLDDALRAGARHAASVLTTRHLHPSLDAILGA